MFDKIDVLQMAQAMATHASARQNSVAENIANADTPGYRARDVATFSETYDSGDGSALRTTRPGHVGAEQVGYRPETLTRADPGTTSPNGNSVSLEHEMVKGVAVKREHDLALAIYRNSMGILRTCLGRSR